MMILVFPVRSDARWNAYYISNPIVSTRAAEYIIQTLLKSVVSLLSSPIALILRDNVARHSFTHLCRPRPRCDPVGQRASYNRHFPGSPESNLPRRLLGAERSFRVPRGIRKSFRLSVAPFLTFTSLTKSTLTPSSSVERSSVITFAMGPPRTKIPAARPRG